jgi:hypothetical protein
MQASRCGSSKLDLVTVQLEIAYSKRQLTPAFQTKEKFAIAQVLKQMRLCIKREADKAKVLAERFLTLAEIARACR